MSNQSKTIQQLDALLPQTQCGDCGYKGCVPYATAIIENNESLDKCAPGGVDTMQAMGDLLQQDVSALLTDMQAKQKPMSLAVIREQDCIGCTKCIKACPVDAIMGSAKLMHSVISDECTGCGLCVEPCPVDCIDMIEQAPLTQPQKQQQAGLARKRYLARNSRLDNEQQQAKQRHKKAKQVHTDIEASNANRQMTVSARQATIAAAVARAKAKKTPS